MFQRILSVILILAGTATMATGAEMFNYIPQTADAAIYLRTEKLFSHPALRQLAGSGDISRIKEELTLIPWGLPDTIIPIFSQNRGYAMLVEYPLDIDRMEAKLREYYRKNPAWVFTRGTKNGLSYLYLTRHRIKRSDKNYTLVFLAPGVILMAGDKYPLSWEVLTGEYNRELGARLQTISAADLLFGYSPEPSKLGFDPMGISSRMKQFEFAVAAPASGKEILLRGEGNCAGPAVAVDCREQLQNFKRIMLVTLFGADQNLFRSIDRTVTAEAEGAKVRFRAEFPQTILDAIRAYYESNSAQFSETLQHQLKK